MDAYLAAILVCNIITFIACQTNTNASLADPTQQPYSSPQQNEEQESNITRPNSCLISPAVREQTQFLRDSVMYIFELEIYNKSEDPLRSDISRTYKPWKWYRTTSEHGKTLLTLSFNYDILSLSILTIGVQRVPLKLRDIPEGCFARLTAEERVDIIRDKVFDNFKRRKSKPKPIGGDEEFEKVIQPEMIYVCNEIIQDVNGKAVFANQCCARDVDGGVVTCSEQEDNFWITVLYVCIGLVKLMIFMFCPLLIPSSMYTASYVAAEYVVKLTKDLTFKMFVSETPTTSVRYKHRFTMEEISEWRRFRDCVMTLPMDRIIDVKINELRIKVKGKRIIPANEPPTGLLRTFYDNLIRCKIRGVEPFKSCCNKSVYSFLEPLIKHKCTWENLVLTVIKIVCLALVPAPFYLRAFIFYKYEEDEIIFRKNVIEGLGLKEEFNPFRMNFVQYFTPTHWLFILAYSVFIVAGLVIGFAEDRSREKLKSIVRSAFHDMENVSRTNVLQVVLGFLLWPFRKLGLLALISCPVVSAVTAPVWASVFVIYSVPTVYLAYRLIYHVRSKLGSDVSMFESDKPLGKAKQTALKMHQKLTSIDKTVHVARTKFYDEEKQSPCVSGFGRMAAFRRLMIQMLVGVFCLVVLFSSVLLMVESFGVIVEVLVFTMMGIIVNAGSTLRYVSMALLVIVYMHNCYDNVYENYLMFNQNIFEAVMEKVEDLKKIASLPSNMQENAAFQVKPVEALDEIPTTLFLEKKDPQWRIGHLMLFLDSFDTPRIPLNLFKKLCEVRVHGAPGPVYINLLKATGKFSIIVVFLFFVMIVVMAFGSAGQMSSTNQTLATLAGGFVPMLLKNVLSTKGEKLDLRTLSFKGQLDEIISEFKQGWPINDMVVEQFDPNAVEKTEEKAEDGAANKTDNDKGSDDKDKKDDSGKQTDDKKEKEDNHKNVQNGKEHTMTTAGSTLMIPGTFSDSTEDVRKVDDHKGGPEWLRRLSINPVEDNQVDIFVDLSVAHETTPWKWMFGGSDESIDGHSMTMLNDYHVPNNDTRLPYGQPYNPDMNTDSLQRQYKAPRPNNRDNHFGM